MIIPAACDLNQLFLPLKDEDFDQDRNQPPVFSAPVSNTCLVLSPTTQEDQDPKDRASHDHGHQQEKDLLSISGSSENFLLSSTIIIDNKSTAAIIGQSTHDKYHHSEDMDESNAKWLMPSKMRWMRKTMASDHKLVGTKPRRRRRRSNQTPQDQQLQNQDNCNSSPSAGFIRVCSDCNTTKTPLWRSGPRGPRSLCNACGIRQRKARRAMAAAAAGGVTGGTHPADPNPNHKVQKENESDGSSYLLPYKKRRKNFNQGIGTVAPKKLKFSDTTMSLGNDYSANLHRAFPEDEKDAAILLMALSCGIMQG